ncbi:hypothetical protein [Rhodoplanes azumiensis]|uniref:Uncharacterized protein n=1 Tax=Rhodoplanes azumiensis TaxID=1897628 RepID=A0ABW5AKW1_9BRAD
MTPKQRLPRRFPVGTRLVVEGEPDRHGTLRVVSRYLVMPNGRRYDLATNASAPNGSAPDAPHPAGPVPPGAVGPRRRRAPTAQA